MYVKKSKRDNGRIYLTIAHGYRENKKMKSRTIESLGYLDDLEKEYEDPIAHFKAVCEERNASAKEKAAPVGVTLYPLQRIDKRTSNRKNIGVAIPLYHYHVLGIEKTLRSKARSRKFDFDTNAVMRLLVSDRFVSPGSKRAAYTEKDAYFFRSAFAEHDLYRALDFFADSKETIIASMNKNIESARGRNKDRVFYDVTNYHFECDRPDTDVVDEISGEVIASGMRKKGVCKKKSGKPIVQVGLLQDADGIPLTFSSFPGNTQDSQTMLPVLKGIKQEMSFGRVIVVADKGLNCSDNIAANIIDGNGYVFSQSIRGTKAPERLRRWVISEDGYKEQEEGTFKIKSCQDNKTIHITGEDGTTKDEDVPVKIVAFWSKKYAERAKHLREDVIKKAKELAASPSQYKRATHWGAAKYVDNIHFDKKTGECLENEGQKAFLNEKKIAEDEACDGYYCIITSETDLADEEIVAIYRGLWQIEESFKITKSVLSARPYYVRTEKHLEAHFLICYIALTILRLLQLDTGKKHSAEAISNEIAAMSGTHLQDNWWIFDHRTDLSDELATSVGLDLTRKNMQLKDIKKVFSK